MAKKVHWTRTRAGRQKWARIRAKGIRARKAAARANVPAIESRRELAIPLTSVLAPLVRKGAEGVCVSCRKAIREHYGHRGVWVGCRAPDVPATATFLLVPVILPADRPMTSGVRERDRAADRGVVHDPTIRTSGGTPRPGFAPRTNIVARVAQRVTQAAVSARERFVYHAKDKRRSLVGASAAVMDAYRGLLRATKPVDATHAGKLAKRPTEANRRSLNWLVEQGLAVKTAIEA